MTDTKGYSKCHLCNNPRNAHELGCVEPLIAADVIDSLVTKIADSLGMVIGTSTKYDKTLGFLFREANDDETDEPKYIMIESTSLRSVVLGLLDNIKEKLDEGNVTLMNRKEALEKARILIYGNEENPEE